MANLQELLSGMAESSLLSSLGDYSKNRNDPAITRNLSKSGIDPSVWSWYDAKIGGANPQDVINKIGDAERITNQNNPQLAQEAEKHRQGIPLAPNTPQPVGQPPQQGQPQQGAQPAGTPQQTQGTQQPVPTTPVSNYAGPSVVDYLNSIGQPSDYNSRTLLARKMGIQNYSGTATQNTQLLSNLRGGQLQANPNVNTSSTPPVISSTPPELPSIGVNSPLLSQYGLSTPNPQQSPMKSFSDTYKELLSNMGVPEIKEEFDNVQKEYDELQNELNDKISEVNDNPWLSEGIRVKEVRKLQEKYEGKTSILTNKLNLYNSLYEQGIDEAKFVAQNAYAQYQFEVGTQLKLYEIAQKQLESERSLTQQEFENRLSLDEASLNREKFDYARQKDDEESTPTPSPYQAEREYRTLQSVAELRVQALSNPGIFGRSAAVPLPDFARSDAFRNFEGQLNTLKSSIITSELTAMREASKTGGALGQISDRESVFLQNALGALNMSQTPQSFVEQLNKIQQSIQRWQQATATYGQPGTVITAPNGEQVIITD